MVSPRVWSISGRRVCLVGGHFLQNFSRDVFNRHPVAIYRRMHSIEISLSGVSAIIHGQKNVYDSIILRNFFLLLSFTVKIETLKDFHIRTELESNENNNNF